MFPLPLALAPGPSLNLTTPALNLYLLAATLTFCLPVLRFTVKVCYNQPRFQCDFRHFFKTALGTRLRYRYCVYLFEHRVQLYVYVLTF